MPTARASAGLWILGVCSLALALAGRPALAQNVSIQNGGTVEMANGGVWDLEGSTMDFGESGATARLSETGEGRVTGGRLRAIRTLDGPSEADVAGLGAVLSASSNLGDVTVTRGHAAQVVGETESIDRFYTIDPSQNNSGLEATLTLSYTDAELNGRSEANLVFFKSEDDGTTWSRKGQSGRSLDGNALTLEGIASFSRWTLGSGLEPRDVIEAEVSRSFGDASGSEDYRLVGLPGAVDRTVSEAVSGEAGTDWQAYRDDGSDSDFLVRYDDADPFGFRPGRGLWLTSLESWTVQDSIESVPLRDSTASIPLNDRWTIVANPFGVPVSWTALQAANDGDLQALWPFEGAFGDTTRTFASAATGRAYYLVHDDQSRDSLRVPHPALTTVKKEAKALSSEGRTASSTVLKLSAAPKKTGATSTVQVGITDSEKAETALIAPPGAFEAVSLRILRNANETGGSSRGQALMRASRHLSEDGETFPIRLTNRTDGPATIQISGADSLNSLSAALLHPEAGKTYDMRSERSVDIEQGQEITELKVAVGTEGYVEDKAGEVVPTEVTLTAYPNPVRRQGTIEYALPEAQEVTFRVYDLLGRRVATLASGQKEAGRHTVSLQAEQLSSGVYFGRLQAGGQTRIQKITVVR